MLNSGCTLFCTPVGHSKLRCSLNRCIWEILFDFMSTSALHFFGAGQLAFSLPVSSTKSVGLIGTGKLYARATYQEQVETGPGHRLHSWQSRPFSEAQPLSSIQASIFCQHRFWESQFNCKYRHRKEA